MKRSTFRFSSPFFLLAWSSLGRAPSLFPTKKEGGIRRSLLSEKRKEGRGVASLSLSSPGFALNVAFFLGGKKNFFQN